MKLIRNVDSLRNVTWVPQINLTEDRPAPRSSMAFLPARIIPMQCSMKDCQLLKDCLSENTWIIAPSEIIIRT